MVDIVTNPEWKAVRILERDEVALGGYGGNMNEEINKIIWENWNPMYMNDFKEYVMNRINKIITRQ